MFTDETLHFFAYMYLSVNIYIEYFSRILFWNTSNEYLQYYFTYMYLSLNIYIEYFSRILFWKTSN